MKVQLGPLFWFEFIRQSRQSFGHWARISFCAIFFFILYVIFGRDELTPGRMPKLAEECAIGYVTLQYLAVLLLTPVFIVSSIIEDRHKRVFEILLTTHVTAQEILLGKLFSRLLHVLIVLTSGIPVLALLQVIGGVNMSFVLWHTSLALVIMLIVGCLAIRASLWASTTLTGIMFTWLLLLPGIGFLLVPFYLVGLIFQDATNLSPWVLGLIAMTIGNSLLAARLMGDAIRAMEERKPTLLELEKLSHPRRLEISEYANDESGRQLTASLTEFEVRIRREHFSYRIAQLGDHPFRWLEENFPPLEWGFWLPISYLIIPSLLALFCSTNSFFYFFMKLLTTYYWYQVAVHTATSLAQDRFLQRFDTLLTLPGEKTQFLAERLIGTCRRYRHLFFNVMLGFGIMAFFQPSYHWWQFPLFFSQLFFWMAAACWLGLQPLSTFVARMLAGSSLILSALASFYCFDLLGVQLTSLTPWLQLIVGLVCPWAAWTTIQTNDVVRYASQLTAPIGYWAMGIICLNVILASLLFQRSLVRLRKMAD